MENEERKEVLEFIRLSKKYGKEVDIKELPINFEENEITVKFNIEVKKTFKVKSFYKKEEDILKLLHSKNINLFHINSGCELDFDNDLIITNIDSQMTSDNLKIIDLEIIFNRGD